MSKIICDVCGTTYPETASQCPICGCAKSAESRTVTGDKVSETAAASYQFVKGGRFSKRNVMKRNKQNLVRQEKRNQEDPENPEEEEDNKGLIIVLLLLLAAIIAVVIYIAVRFFGPAAGGPGTEPTGNPIPTPGPSTAATTEPTLAPTDAPTEEPTDAPTDAPTTEPTYPCTGLSLKRTEILLEEPGSTAIITVSVSPANTTDPLLYTSDNDDVATVSDTGVVTAVGEGTAQITITCGSFQVHCNVEVKYPATEPTTEPTTPPTDAPTEPSSQLKLNRTDFSLFAEGETWDLYSGTAPKNKVTWRSSNENVATVSNGVVTAVGPGTATIYAEYEGQELSCVVRCNWTEQEPSTEPTLDPNETYSISHSDVSLSVGESFNLILTDSSGNAVNVSWQASSSGYVSISGNRITGLERINSSSFTVYTTIGGKTYSCIVRVK